MQNHISWRAECSEIDADRGEISFVLSCPDWETRGSNGHTTTYTIKLVGDGINAELFQEFLTNVNHLCKNLQAKPVVDNAAVWAEYDKRRAESAELREQAQASIENMEHLLEQVQKDWGIKPSSSDDGGKNETIH